MLLISVLVGTSLCYRYLITIPEVTRSVLAYQQREIGAVYQSLNERFGLFQTMNYDYAVWNDSYQFIQDGNEEFVKNNYVSDMFVSLKIDGIYYVNLQGEVIWSKEFDWQQAKLKSFNLAPETYPLLVKNC